MKYISIHKRKGYNTHRNKTAIIELIIYFLFCLVNDVHDIDHLIIYNSWEALAPLPDFFGNKFW